MLVSATALAAGGDIFSVKFSPDGRHLITGGGGIRVWDSTSGALVRELGGAGQLDHLFGAEYSRIGAGAPLTSFRDLVVNGSYPEGKIIVLPSSLSRTAINNVNTAPDFIGGYFPLSGATGKRIGLDQQTPATHCAGAGRGKDYIGPVVASGNGRYAAVVVNTCPTARAGAAANPSAALYVVNLDTLAVSHSRARIDAGVYALGISNDGSRVAYVGAESFSVLDLAATKDHLLERYDGAAYQPPEQYNTLTFTDDGRKLVSLRHIYDIETGHEQRHAWHNPALERLSRRISNVRISPDQHHFVLVRRNPPLLTVDEAGISHVKTPRHDMVMLLDAKNGKQRPLAVSEPGLPAQDCVTDVSPDSRRVAVGCKRGVLKIFDLASGALLWQNHAAGQQDKPAARMLQVRAAPPGSRS
jgi:WD40 repeat protein